MEVRRKGLTRVCRLTCSCVEPASKRKTPVEYKFCQKSRKVRIIDDRDEVQHVIETMCDTAGLPRDGWKSAAHFTFPQKLADPIKITGEVAEQDIAEWTMDRLVKDGMRWVKHEVGSQSSPS